MSSFLILLLFINLIILISNQSPEFSSHKLINEVDTYGYIKYNKTDIGSKNSMFGALWTKEKVDYNQDFQIVFSIKKVDTKKEAYGEDGFGVIIGKERNYSFDLAWGNFFYSGLSNLIVGVLDLYQNSNNDVPVKFISIHECINTTCTTAEKENSTYRIVTKNDVSSNILIYINLVLCRKLSNS